MNKITSIILFSLILFSANAMAGNYIIDKKGMHASIQFKISHLGYSWLWGRFNDFEGTSSYDKNNPAAAKIKVTINTKSIDTNHAERDKHLRGKDFLNVEKHPQAQFISTSFKQSKDNTGILKGNLTLHGITKPIVINVKFIGEGKDPWGGYRMGWEGTSKITLADFGITKNLGPASKSLDLIFAIESIRQ